METGAEVKSFMNHWMAVEKDSLERQVVIHMLDSAESRRFSRVKGNF